jgi:hypothetical protein
MLLPSRRSYLRRIRLMSRREAYLTLIDLRIAAQLHSRAKALLRAFAAPDLNIRFTEC